MKEIIMKRFFAISFLAAISLNISCVQDSFERSGETGTQVREVEISIATGPARATRALGDGQSTEPGGGRENTINTLDLPIFEADGKFLYRSEATHVSTSGGTQSMSVYKVKLRETTASLDIHFLANCRPLLLQFDDINPEVTQYDWSDIQALLVDDAPEDIVDKEKCLPMHGWLDDKTISSNAAPNRWTEVVNLKRSVASFDVFVEKVTATNRFALANVFVYRAPSLGYIGELRDGDRDNNHAANIATELDSGEDDAKTPDIDETTMSAGGFGIMTNKETGIAYDAIVCQMYVYENPYVTTDDLAKRPTRIIVAGLYQTEGVYTRYYYPIDILDAAGNYMAIERNHKYEFVITAVTGPGYATLQEAQTGALRNFNGKTVEVNDETVLVNRAQDEISDGIPNSG